MNAMDVLARDEELGRIEISKYAVSTQIGHIASECYGIVGMAARGLRDGIAERLNRDNIHRGVSVSVVDGGLSIGLYIIVEYGVRISEVAQNLMSAVKYGVEKNLGIPVGTVDVFVQGIHGGDRGHGEIL